MRAASRRSDITWSFSTRRRRRSHRYLWLLPVVALLLVAGAAVASYLLRPTLTLHATGRGLASLTTDGHGLQLLSAQARDQGTTVSLRDPGGTLKPSTALPAGATLALHPAGTLPPGGTVTITVKARNPWWASWAEGSKVTRSVQVSAPAVKVETTVTQFATGSSPVVTFTQPVTVVTWTSGGATKTLHLRTPARHVHLTLPANHPDHGTLVVRAASYDWETLSGPATLSFFEGTGPQAVISPPPGSTISPTTPIRLTLSQPVDTLFGVRRPALSVARLTSTPAGTWTTPSLNVLQFKPAPGALWPNQIFEMHLPLAVHVVGTSTTTSFLSYKLPQGSMTRLQQELAALSYLPFRWTPAPGHAGLPRSVNAISAVDYTGSPGHFSWDWAPPPLLRRLWQPAVNGIMTQGAIRAFENRNGLNVNDGVNNPLLWPYLAQAVASDSQNPNGYTWVDVNKSLPQRLTVWHNGKPIIEVPTNTGIPQAPTADGTFVVYLRYRSQIMRGKNPNGTKYADPVKWVSYFNGSDAIHGFLRASYGFPQSLGCAELTYANAARVYPYTPIGTLVTVH